MSGAGHRTIAVLEILLDSGFVATRTQRNHNQHAQFRPLAGVAQPAGGVDKADSPHLHALSLSGVEDHPADQIVGDEVHQQFLLHPVGPAETLSPHIWRRVDRTITRLKLNDRECRDARKTYALDYWNGEIPFSRLVR